MYSKSQKEKHCEIIYIYIYIDHTTIITSSGRDCSTRRLICLKCGQQPQHALHATQTKYIWTDHSITRQYIFYQHIYKISFIALEITPGYIYILLMIYAIIHISGSWYVYTGTAGCFWHIYKIYLYT